MPTKDLPRQIEVALCLGNPCATERSLGFGCGHVGTSQLAGAEAAFDRRQFGIQLLLMLAINVHDVLRPEHIGISRRGAQQHVLLGRPQGVEAGFDSSVGAGDRRVGAAGRPQRDVDGDSSHGADAGLGLGAVRTAARGSRTVGGTDFGLAGDGRAA